jgi:large subunit ribosomal protein L17
MRHRKAGLKLNRTSSHRDAMFRNMVTSLFKHDRIRTTDAKAKELRRWADHMITLAKRGDLHARRQALSVIREKEVVFRLFDEAADRYGNIAGGYTRVVKIGVRPGDAAGISLVELAAPEKSRKKKKETPKKEKAAAGKKRTVKEKAEKAVAAEPEKTEVVEKESEDKTP